MLEAATPARLERAAYCLGNSCSIHLSYGVWPEPAACDGPIQAPSRFGYAREVSTGRRAVPLLLAAAALGAPPASAFVRTLSTLNSPDGGKHYLWWPTREVDYRIQSDCAPINPAVTAAGEQGTFGQLCRDAIGRSFQAWQTAGADAGSVPCTDLTLRSIGETSVREIGYDAKNPDEGNLVFFQPQNCQGTVPFGDPCWQDDSCDAKYACFSGGTEAFAITTTTYRASDGMLLDADIEVNAAPAPDGYNYSAETGGPLPGTVDIQNVLTHEVGHLLGLAHNCGIAGAPPCTPELALGTMYASASPGETQKRTLKADDIAGVCHIYPAGEDTRAVNLSDAVGPDGLKVSAEASCASTQSAPSAWGLALVLLLLLRLARVDEALPAAAALAVSAPTEAPAAALAPTAELDASTELPA
jgi:hypothetical protein